MVLRSQAHRSAVGIKWDDLCPESNRVLHGHHCVQVRLFSLLVLTCLNNARDSADSELEPAYFNFIMLLKYSFIGCREGMCAGNT